MSLLIRLSDLILTYINRNVVFDIRFRVGVIKIVIVINCNLITFFKIIENNCNSVFTLITIIEM